MSWYITAIKNYANFKGRARRKEYWMFILFNYLFGLACSLADGLLGLQIPLEGKALGIFGAVYGLFVLIPSFSVSVRRLHDIDKSGWWLLLSLLPVIGWVWLLVYSTMGGTPCDNRFGADPKAASVQ